MCHIWHIKAVKQEFYALILLNANILIVNQTAFNLAIKGDNWSFDQ